MKTDLSWVTLGRFGRTHGIKGFITIHSFTEPRENILDYQPCYAFINKQWQLLNLTKVEITGKHILAQIEGFDGRENAATLTNIEIGVPKEQLPELESGEFYWHQLIGLLVVTVQGTTLGKVVEIMPTGSNDVLIVEGKKRLLIPYLPDITIIEVSLKQQRMVVEWDEDF